jgi:cytochrome c oxidase cbb3-type subunit 2
MIQRLGSLLVFAGFALQVAAELAPETSPASVALGRQVYIAEGCINCHSQYVRPQTADVERWGPQRPLAEALEQTPPLFGNRRQGPDLQNVANRRSREWQRVHLLEPRAITSGSRMPAYAHLFAGAAQRGEALLDYLDMLGDETRVDHWQKAWAWQPAEAAATAVASHGADLFAQWCAACHGSRGRGDEILAKRLPTPPRDLVTESWRFQPPTADRAREQLALARLIKFGQPGTTMAGREYLTDREVLALAAYVQELHGDAPRK